MVHTTDYDALSSVIGCRFFDFERDGIHVAGGGFAERPLTLVVSGRKQGRQVLDFLVAAS